ncbi:hypothetical protein FOZ63_015533 [Perkinsus olseni]|nr:hypothetical protein FOZ63_015533 [Perkinsus olseni]
MCLSRQRCLLLGYRHKFPDQVKKVLRNAMKSHRGLRVVALDTSKYRLKLDPAIVPLNEGGGQRDGKSKKGGSKSLSFMCLNTPDRKVDLDGLTKGMVEVLPLVDKGKQLERDYDAVSFLKECDSGESPNMKEMLDLPSICNSITTFSTPLLPIPCASVALRPPKQPKARQQQQQQQPSTGNDDAGAKDERQRLREEFHERRKQSGGRDALEEEEPPIVTDVDDYDDADNDDDAEWDELLNAEEEEEELNLY